MSDPRQDEDKNEDEDNGANEADHVWLLARERGEDIGDVPAGTRAPYEKLGAMLGSGMAPSPGFRRRVLDAIDAEAAAAAAARVTAAAAEAAGTAGAAAATAATAAGGTATAATAEPVEVAAGAGTVEAAAERVGAVGMAGAGTIQAAEIAESVRRAVVVELDQGRARRKQQQRWRLAMIGGLAAAAAVAGVWIRRAPAPSHGGPGDELTAQLGSGKRIALMTTVRHGDRVVRGDLDEATVDDTLDVRAAAVGPAELRVYGGSRGQRLARCNEGEPGDCKIVREGDIRRFLLEVPLNLPGKVRVVVFLGENIPTWTGAFDPDLESAAGAGIEYEVQKPATRVH